MKQEGLSIVLDNDFSLPFRPEAAAPYHFGVLLYDDASGELSYEDFCETRGGQIPGHAGLFTAVIYDLDNSALRFDGKASLESFRAYLTNVARGRYVSIDKPEERPAVLSFSLSSIGEELIEGTFNYFGLLSDTSTPNTVYIIITDLSGGRYLYVTDVSSSLRQGADLSVQWDYELPSPDTGSAGFSPVLKEWGDVWYDVPIGL